MQAERRRTIPGEGQAYASPRARGGMEDHIAPLIPLMAERIASEFRPTRIILFGSRGRGDSLPESDIDLLVVLPSVASRRQTAIDIRKAIADIRPDLKRPMVVAKDIIVATPSDIENYGDVSLYAIYWALREGIVLYESHAPEAH